MSIPPHHRHLVLSGGGINGLFMYGALKQAHINKLWSHDTLKSIWATSVGAIIAVMMVLNFDWETLDKYIIERPWHTVFALSGESLFDAYEKKGLFGYDLIYAIFQPLFGAKDVPMDISLGDFCEKTGIQLHFFSFELNACETIELTSSCSFNVPLLKAIQMSCALPGVFSPVFLPDFPNCCFIDGGITTNYPLNECLSSLNTNTTDSVLAIRFKNDELSPNDNAMTITETSNILNFFMAFTSNIIDHVLNKTNKCDNSLATEIICPRISLFNIDAAKEVISSADKRREYIQEGERAVNNQ